MPHKLLHPPVSSSLAGIPHPRLIHLPCSDGRRLSNQSGVNDNTCPPDSSISNSAYLATRRFHRRQDQFSSHSSGRYSSATHWPRWNELLNVWDATSTILAISIHLIWNLAARPCCSSPADSSFLWSVIPAPKHRKLPFGVTFAAKRQRICQVTKLRGGYRIHGIAAPTVQRAEFVYPYPSSTASIAGDLLARSRLRAINSFA